MTRQELDELTALYKKANGPFGLSKDQLFHTNLINNRGGNVAVMYDSAHTDIAEYLIKAANAVPKLIAEIEMVWKLYEAEVNK